MAIDPANQIRPGIYFQFVTAAQNQFARGVRGIVAIPLKEYAPAVAPLNVTAKSFYTVESRATADELFGSANTQSIKFALQAGAKEVIVYTLPEIDGTTVTEDGAYGELFSALDTQKFNVLVFDGEVSAAVQDDALAWLKTSRSEENKHFFIVFGGNSTDDQDLSASNARTTRLADDYSVNLINGVVIEDSEYSSGEFAPYIAGLIAGTPINASITYKVVPVADVTKRLRNSDIKTALQAGSLVLMHDGENVKVEQGVTTSKSKIRIQSARQAITTDLTKLGRENYIGKLTNNEAGQATLISAVKKYLEELEVENVLESPIVQLDETKVSAGDAVYLSVSYTELDSMERIFITINI